MVEKLSREERFRALEAKRRAKEGLPTKEGPSPNAQVQAQNSKARTSSRVTSRSDSFDLEIPGAPIPGSSRVALFDFMDDAFGEHIFRFSFDRFNWPSIILEEDQQPSQANNVSPKGGRHEGNQGETVIIITCSKFTVYHIDPKPTARPNERRAPTPQLASTSGMRDTAPVIQRPKPTKRQLVDGQSQT